MLDKVFDAACRSVGPTPAASFENLALCQNLANLCLFLHITLENLHWTLSKLGFLCRILWEFCYLIHYFDTLHYFDSVIIPEFCSEFYVNAFLV